MVAAPSPRPPIDLPTDLALLVTLHRALPPRSARWRTVQGKVFLTALARAADLYQARTCAEALGVSTSAVYQMLDRPLPSKPVPWPTEDDLRPLLRSWRSVQVVQKRGDTVRRNSREFRLVHLRLTRLLETYGLAEIAAAIKTDSRTLARYTQPPPQAPGGADM